MAFILKRCKWREVKNKDIVERQLKERKEIRLQKDRLVRELLQNIALHFTVANDIVSTHAHCSHLLFKADFESIHLFLKLHPLLSTGLSFGNSI